MSKVIDILKNHKIDLFNKYPIKTMALFGSFARGDEHDGSDVDILVEFLHPDGWKFLELANELEDLLDKKVDLVSKAGVKEKYLNFFSSQLIYV